MSHTRWDREMLDLRFAEALQAVEDLEAQRDALLALVEAVEWVTDVDDLGGTYQYCPWCYMPEGALAGDGHEPNCRRQKEIRKARGNDRRKTGG